MGRPQFNLKDILLALFLIALGCGALRATDRSNSSAPVWLALLLGISGPILICTGLATPLHRKSVGAFVGALMVCAFVIGAIMTYATHRN
jgi:hypothetical protein